MRRSGKNLLVVAVAGALVAAACSGGGDDTSSTEATDPPATDAVVATDAPPATDPPATDPPEPETTVATTTTTEPPQVVPLGVRWDDAVPVVGGFGQGFVSDMVVLGDDIWVTAQRWNAPMLLRSSDGGATWEDVLVEAPPSSGSISIRQIVQGPDGRYVAHGTRAFDCSANIDVGGGFRETSICFRFRAIVFVSDDGLTWRRIEPDAMASGGSSRIQSLVATADGYLAAGTVLDPNWRTVLWTSPDGETWTVAREITGTDGPMSAIDLVADGETIVLLTAEHPCSEPFFNSVGAGWSLGVDWPNHARIFAGPSVDELALLTPADHPLAPEPRPVDCAVDDPFDLAQEPYPRLLGELVGGEIVVLEDFVPADQVELLESDDDVDPDTIGTRRFARLTGDSWESIEAVGVRVAANFTSNIDLVDVDGEPGILEYRPAGSGLIEIIPILPDGDGTFAQRPVDRAVFGSGVSDVVFVDGQLVAVSSFRDDPFNRTPEFTDPESVYVFRSVETTGEREQPCDLVAGGVCQFTDLSTVDGYPDFAGTDLSGIDLSFSDVEEADFSGADLSGARLWGADSDPGASFVDATFAGAQLQDGRLGDASGATFVGADLTSARLEVAAGADFTGANLDGASLRDATGAILIDATLARTSIGFFELPDFGGTSLEAVNLEPLAEEGAPGPELSLAGFDLTRARVEGPSEEQRVVITDLTGAILDSTTFKNADLSLVDPAIDLTDVDVWDDSICPDGLPPDDGVIGTCVRGLADE